MIVSINQAHVGPIYRDAWTQHHPSRDKVDLPGRGPIADTIGGFSGQICKIVTAPGIESLLVHKRLDCFGVEATVVLRLVDAVFRQEARP